jgi:NAD(P)-dependent dehydrogenase (short-subunit alcohol dehydrogenase family)
MKTLKETNKTTKLKTVLITGASSGFGKATAELLAGQGYRVFGTSRHSNGVDPADYEMLTLDVRDDASVRRCVDAMLAKTGRIDILINNAGYELSGALEETAVEEAKAQFETNFFGVLRMTNAVLPVMREQREGRIINIGSLAGLVSVPFHGMYSASKYALEGYTEALRQEVRPFNIRVSLVEPGFSSTNLARSGKQSSRLISDYSPMRERISPVFIESIHRGQQPEEIARLILALIRKASPRLRYRVGSDSVWLPRVKMMVTEASFEAGVRRKFHLDG